MPLFNSRPQGHVIIAAMSAQQFLTLDGPLCTILFELHSGYRSFEVGLVDWQVNEWSISPVYRAIIVT